MKISRTIILLMLIVAVLVVGCEGQLNPLGDPLGDKDARGEELSQENIDTIAFLGFSVLMHTTLYVDAGGFDPNPPGLPQPLEWEDFLTFEFSLNDQDELIGDIEWTDFDVGESIEILSAHPALDNEDYRFFDFIKKGELIVLSGDASTTGNPAEVEMEIEIEITNISTEEPVPDGTYTVIFLIENFNPEKDEIGNVIFHAAAVNGTIANPGVIDVGEDPD